MKSVERKKKYHSFLLRIWLDEFNGTRTWHISLENPTTRERRGFATPKDLQKYLERLFQENDNHAI